MQSGGVLNIVCPYRDDWNDDIATAITKYIITTHQNMKLSFADIPSASLFANVMKKIDGEIKERTSYHVPLSMFATYEDYVSSLNKNIYKNIRKAYNHIKTDSRHMELKVYTQENMPKNSYMFKLWKLYFRRKLAWRHHKAAFYSELSIRIKALYETALGCANHSLKTLSASELYVLHINNRPAAFMIVYRHRKHLLMPKLAIDSSFSRYSPGILLILESSKKWIDEGITDFDMCRGDERYKKEMGGLNEPLCRIDVKIKK